jgi:hypothetical protein
MNKSRYSQQEGKGNERETIQGSAYSGREGFIVGNNQEREPPCATDNTGQNTDFFGPKAGREEGNRAHRHGNSGKMPVRDQIGDTVSKQYVENGLGRVLTRKKRETPPVPAKVTGEVEARILAMACSQPPEGHSRWTLRLFEEQSKKFVGLHLSDTKIRAVLKKHR